MDNFRKLVQAVRRRLEAEIAILDCEISRLSGDASHNSFPVSLHEVSRIMPADDACSVDSFRTADFSQHSQQSQRHLGSCSLESHQHTHQHSSVCSTISTSSAQPLKVPATPFVADNIDMWFWSMERWFEGTNVVDDNHRFSAVLLALPLPTVAVFKEQLDNLPQVGKYQFAKKLISKHFARNEFDRIKTLVDNVELGDAKPSELYAHMREIAGNVVSHATLKGLWIMRLPDQWRPSLALTSNEPLDFLHAADLMHDVTPRSSICSINPTSATDAVAADIQHPNQLVCALGKPKPTKKKFFSRGSNRTPVSSQSADQSLCCYHAAFGARARNCKQPCSWKPKAPSTDD